MKIVASTDRAFLPTLKKVAGRSRVQGAAAREAREGYPGRRGAGWRQSGSPFHQAIRQSVARPDSAEESLPKKSKKLLQIRKEEGDALRFAAQRIMAFHERQRTKTWMYQDGAATLGQVVTPLDAVGVYVPGGKAVYPSTVLMSAIPARWRV